MRVGRAEIEQDFYAMLGVPPAASESDIRRAHKRIARTTHPDLARSPDAERRMKEVNLAASVLLNPAARARYDHLRGTGAHLRPEPPPVRRPTSSPRAHRVWPPPPKASMPSLRQALLGAESPISSRLFVFALATTIVVGVISTATRERAPVASDDYRIPSGPEMATVWTPTR